MSYVYVKTEPGLWTVGHYHPAGDWQSESDHGSKDEAAARVHYLNGGDAPAQPRASARALVELHEAAAGFLAWFREFEGPQVWEEVNADGGCPALARLQRALRAVTIGVRSA